MMSFDKKILVDLLNNRKYFVIWRTPGTNDIQLLSGAPKKIKSDQIRLHSGFVFFPFEGEGYLFDGNDYKVNSTELISPYITDKTEYLTQCQSYIDNICEGKFDKLVLSRIKSIEHSPEFSLSDYFFRLEQQYPDAFVYLTHLPEYGFWCGASPEVLLTEKNNVCTTMSLAGTLSKEHAPEWSQKELQEQRFVTDYIQYCFHESGFDQISISNQETVTAGQVVHLRNRFSAVVNERAKPFELLRLLFPTPAVCGLPKDGSKKHILQTEKHKRELYSGFLGPIRNEHDFHFQVNLRCMKIKNQHCYLYLGGGITANSDPEKEWQETELKSKTLSQLL